MNCESIPRINELTLEFCLQRQYRTVLIINMTSFRNLSSVAAWTYIPQNDIDHITCVLTTEIIPGAPLLRIEFRLKCDYFLITTLRSDIIVPCKVDVPRGEQHWTVRCSENGELTFFDENNMLSITHKINEAEWPLIVDKINTQRDKMSTQNS